MVPCHSSRRHIIGRQGSLRLVVNLLHDVIETFIPTHIIDKLLLLQAHHSIETVFVHGIGNEILLATHNGVEAQEHSRLHIPQRVFFYKSMIARSGPINLWAKKSKPKVRERDLKTHFIK